MKFSIFTFWTAFHIRHLDITATFCDTMLLTSYSLVLHWHQIRMASIWGDIHILLALPSCGLMIPSSSATPACVAIPPLLLFLYYVISYHCWYGDKHLRVETRTWILSFFYQPRHIFEEEIVHMFLIHITELNIATQINLQHCNFYKSKQIKIFIAFSPEVEVVVLLSLLVFIV